MDRVKSLLVRLGIGAGGLTLGFLVGYLSQVGARRTVQDSLDATRQELQTARSELQLHGLQTRVGAAVAEAARGNFERARQLAASFYQELDSVAPSVTDATTQEAIRNALRERDEMITLLSRAAPESVARLMMLYTRLYGVFDTFGRRSPAMVTPPAADSTAPPSTR
jgi:hypothetical protein